MEKTKTNKKSKSSLIVLLVAILLCVAVVLGLGGFTLAKYISSNSVETQTASVAKWGYVITADTSLFGSQYSKGVAVDSTESDSSIDVDVSSENAVVAPGTSGYMTFSVTGSAEVMSQITVTATGDETVKLTWKDNDQEVVYEPIKWTLKQKTGTATEYSEIEGASGVSLSEIVEKLSAINLTFEPNDTTNLPVTYELSWEWALETDDVENANLYDTILGAIANGKKGTTTESGTEIEISDSTTAKVGDDSYTASTSVSLDLKITVEQIQTTQVTE